MTYVKTRSINSAVPRKLLSDFHTMHAGKYTNMLIIFPWSLIFNELTHSVFIQCIHPTHHYNAKDLRLEEFVFMSRSENRKI